MRMTKKLDRQSPSLIKTGSGINLKTIMATPHIIPSESANQKLNKPEKLHYATLLKKYSSKE